MDSPELDSLGVEARCSTLLASIPGALVAIDRQGVLRYVSARAATILASDRRTLVGTSFRCLLDGPSHHPLDATLALLFGTPGASDEHPTESEIGATTIEMHAQLAHRDERIGIELSSVRNGELHVVLAALTDLTGRELAIADLADRGLAITDVTDRGLAITDLADRGLAIDGHDVNARMVTEKALRESEEKFSRAFRACPDSVSVTEMSTGLLLEVNDGFEQLFGYTRAEVIGKTTLELGFWPIAEERLRMLELIRTQGSLRDFRTKNSRRDGQIRDTLVSAEQVEIGGRACLVLILRDITEINRTNEARAHLEAQLLQAQKLEALGTLSGGIAHDFNNILTAIYSFADLSMRNVENPIKVRKYLTELRRASERAADLVKQILAFSRQQKQERRPSQIQRIVREVLKLLRATLPATIEIDAFIADDVPVILADPGQIHQVMMNLCTNAAHAMRGSPGRLRVRLEKVDVTEAMAQAIPELHVGRFAHLTVADSGHGMSAETVKRIYEPFFTTKSPGEGTGLGLPVVHGIVRAHEGAIVVRSAPGEGTTFELYFPENASEVASSETLPIATPRGRGESVLFVDDEQSICDVGRGILEYVGYQVTTMTDPERALATFRARPDGFHVIVTDLTMPKLTGIDLAQRVLELRPATPVVLLSGFSATWTQQKVREMGVNELVAKPFTFEHLVGAVRRALEASAHRSPQYKPRRARPAWTPHQPGPR